MFLFLCFCLRFVCLSVLLLPFPSLLSTSNTDPYESLVSSLYRAVCLFNYMCLFLCLCFYPCVCRGLSVLLLPPLPPSFLVHSSSSLWPNTKSVWFQCDNMHETFVRTVTLLKSLSICWNATPVGIIPEQWTPLGAKRIGRCFCQPVMKYWNKSH